MPQPVGNIDDEDSVLLTTYAALTFFWISFFHGGVWSQHPEQHMHSRQLRAELTEMSHKSWGWTLRVFDLGESWGSWNIYRGELTYFKKWQQVCVLRTFYVPVSLGDKYIITSSQKNEVLIGKNLFKMAEPELKSWHLSGCGVLDSFIDKHTEVCRSIPSEIQGSLSSHYWPLSPDQYTIFRVINLYPKSRPWDLHSANSEERSESHMPRGRCSLTETWKQ